MGTFIARICCAHRWIKGVERKIAVERCADCRAWCRRDAEGRIIDYTRPAPVPKEHLQ